MDRVIPSRFNILPQDNDDPCTELEDSAQFTGVRGMVSILLQHNSARREGSSAKTTGSSSQCDTSDQGGGNGGGIVEHGRLDKAI